MSGAPQRDGELSPESMGYPSDLGRRHELGVPPPAVIYQLPWRAFPKEKGWKEAKAYEGHRIFLRRHPIAFQIKTPSGKTIGEGDPGSVVAFEEKGVVCWILDAMPIIAADGSLSFEGAPVELTRENSLVAEAALRVSQERGETAVIESPSAVPPAPPDRTIPPLPIPPPPRVAPVVPPAATAIPAPIAGGAYSEDGKYRYFSRTEWRDRNGGEVDGESVIDGRGNAILGAYVREDGSVAVPFTGGTARPKAAPVTSLAEALRQRAAPTAPPPIPDVGRPPTLPPAITPTATVPAGPTNGPAGAGIPPHAFDLGGHAPPPPSSLPPVGPFSPRAVDELDVALHRVQRALDMAKAAQTNLPLLPVEVFCVACGTTIEPAKREVHAQEFHHCGFCGANLWNAHDHDGHHLPGPPEGAISERRPREASTPRPARGGSSIPARVEAPVPPAAPRPAGSKRRMPKDPPADPGVREPDAGGSPDPTDSGGTYDPELAPPVDPEGKAK